MQLSSRDKRALLILAFAVVSIVGLRLTVLREEAPVPALAISQEELLKKQLIRAQQAATRLPSLQETRQQFQAALERREAGLLRAATAAQAQEQMVQILRELASKEHLELGSVQIGALEAYGDAYAEASVTVNFECQIEQLVNLLAGLANRPELMATKALQIQATNPKTKSLQVRLTVSGLIPVDLVPELAKRRRPQG